jgi:hypothetical protein
MSASWRSEWQALAAWIEGLLEAGRLFLSAAQIRSPQHLPSDPTVVEEVGEGVGC